MKHASTLFHLPPRAQSRATERGQLLQWFVDQLNRGRVPGGRFKPLTIGRVARLLQGISVSDLYAVQTVFKDTERWRDYGAACRQWWWSLRPDDSSSKV